MPVMRIPYTDPLPAPRIIPSSASSAAGAVDALVRFLAAGRRRHAAAAAATPVSCAGSVLLTGAGISVASGLADYRGTQGTYTLNRTYRPVYYNEFVGRHDARKRYWARSFFGFVNLQKARPNAAHFAVAQLGRMGVVREVVTQNVDSFHPQAHPALHTLELHGYLRSTVCLSCRSEMPRDVFQAELERLNPPWADFLQEMIASGALDTENPAERQRRGLKTNPDGDLDLGGGVDYSAFRYPACPQCLREPAKQPDGAREKVVVDEDGAWTPDSTGGILKPAVIMFGESIPEAVKAAAEKAIEDADRLLVVGSSLATYSAWRLVKKASQLGMPIGILNVGGVRGEEAFFQSVGEADHASIAVRCQGLAEEILPQLAQHFVAEAKASDDSI